MEADDLMSEPQPFLRIPPFPGAKVHSLVRPRSGPAEMPSDQELDALVDEVEGLDARPHQRERFRNELERFEYVNPFTGEAMAPAEAIALCAFWRDLIESNRDIGSAVGFAFWKRPTVAPLLWNGFDEVRFVSRLGDVDRSRAVAVWKARTPPDLLAELESSGLTLVEVEDGFIRSAGLGADCVPPLSITVDRLGVHFDASAPSEIERLIEDSPFSADLIERATRLRQLIVASGVGKYGAGTSAPPTRKASKPHVLVPGQVEDDRAVLSSSGIRTNLELLIRAREQRPDAHIIYKPHPDVEAGHRAGALSDVEALRFADEVVRDAPIGPLISMADEVHVIGSLAGFEALLRDKPVTTYGAPFYAGWGLTRDLGPVPERRTAKRSVDELVAATLLLYPRYLDPISGLPCPPEILIRRIAEGSSAQAGGIVVQLRRLQGRWKKRIAGAGRS